MDIFTLLWVILMGGSGVYLGINALLKGELSFIAPLSRRNISSHNNSFYSYLLTFVFIISGFGLFLICFLTFLD